MPEKMRCGGGGMSDEDDDAFEADLTDLGLLVLLALALCSGAWAAVAAAAVAKDAALPLIALAPHAKM
jgi:hypothetical protein